MNAICYHALVYASELAVVCSQKNGNNLVICNVASMAGILPQKEPIYASTKAAVIHFSRSMADVFPGKVRTNCVCPNAAQTGFGTSADTTGTKANAEFAKLMEQFIVPVDAVTDAMLRSIEDESLSGLLLGEDEISMQQR
jgi:3-oxoacyl-[acyl-carrier protein] reductase